MSTFDDLYYVKQIKGGVGREFIREHHYSHSCHNGPMCWGLFQHSDSRMIGVIAFATPNSENVRRAPFGVGFEDRVTELHRLVILDGTPTNTESWFIARGLRGLCEYRPKIRAVLSFADSTEGHIGTIYQATNALFTGTTSRARFWRDKEGRLRHPRQSGHNVTPAEAKEKGWTAEMRDAKLRYVFIVGSPAERRKWRKKLLLTELPYPHMTD
jgi:hypothetical protein